MCWRRPPRGAESGWGQCGYEVRRIRSTSPRTAFLPCPLQSLRLSLGWQALTTMTHTSQILTHAAHGGAVSHSFGYGDVNPIPAVAVYSISGISASSEQRTLQSKQ